MHALGRPPLRRAVAGAGREAPLLTRSASLAALGSALCLALGAGAASDAERRSSTPPVSLREDATARRRELRIAFLGDSGTGDAYQRAVRDRLLEREPALVFLLGDNIYTAGRSAYFKSRYDDVYAPVMARGATFHAALGNHDVAFCRAGKTPLAADRDAYLWRTARCDVEEQLAHAPFGYVGKNRYYSVVGGSAPDDLVAVFVLDSNTLGRRQSKLPSGSEDRAQLAWLEAGLAASRARWKVVAMHHPVHTPRARGGFFGLGGHTRDERLEAQLAPIFERHGVAAVFAGHNHFYARMAPRNGVRYFVSGGGGRGVYGFVPAPGYVVAGGAYHHFVLLTVKTDEVSFEAVDASGAVRDSGSFGKVD